MEAAQAEWAEVDVPFAIIDLDQADVLLAQRLADVDPVLVPADPAIAADAPDLIVAEIVQRGQASRIGSWGGVVDRGGRRIDQRLVGPERVVLMAPAIEAALLLPAAGSRWAGALALERQVHALVAPVLMRGAGLGEIGQDAEADHQTASAERRPRAWVAKGTPLSGADPLREPVLVEEPLEDRARLDQLGAGERLTGQGAGGCSHQRP